MKLILEQVDVVEGKIRQLENDANVTKEQMRIFMQSPMPCGHAVGNLMTCATPPWGCVVCNRHDIVLLPFVEMAPPKADDIKLIIDDWKCPLCRKPGLFEYITDGALRCKGCGIHWNRSQMKDIQGTFWVGEGEEVKKV